MRKGSAGQESYPLYQSGLRRNNGNRKQPQDEFFCVVQFCSDHREKNCTTAGRRCKNYKAARNCSCARVICQLKQETGETGELKDESGVSLRKIADGRQRRRVRCCSQTLCCRVLFSARRYAFGPAEQSRDRAAGQTGGQRHWRPFAEVLPSKNPSPV